MRRQGKREFSFSQIDAALSLGKRILYATYNKKGAVEMLPLLKIRFPAAKVYRVESGIMIVPNCGQTDD